MKINKKIILTVSITLAAGIFLGWLLFSGTDHKSGQRVSDDLSTVSEKQVIWTCSMHPQIRRSEPGKCPICGMDLIPLDQLAEADTTGPDEIAMSESAMKLAEVQTATVRKGSAERAVYLLGIVKPDERNIAEITARFGGRIESLNINFTGQQVKKGEELATIYAPTLIAAQKELQEAARQKEKNRSFYDAARTKLSLWDLTDEQIDAIEQSNTIVRDFPLLSPISGTVTRRLVAIGDYIKEGNSLFEVTDLRKVWVMFDAYENDLPWIRTGDRINFTIPSLPDREFNGRVKYIDPFIDERTRVAKVRVELDNPQLTLKPEMFANGVLHSTMGGKDELLIPKTAVLWTGKRSVVFVRVPGREMPTFNYREIILGPEAGDDYVVAAGLEAGEEIAVNGVFKIDAAAQLAGKTSMMNPDSGASVNTMPGMKMGGEEEHRPAKKEKEAMAMIRVYGNCDMCKARIEKAAKSLQGVLVADWNVDTKMLHLEYDPNAVSADDVEKAIAAVGHDTEHHRAPDEAYNDLPGCCLYDRPEK